MRKVTSQFSWLIAILLGLAASVHAAPTKEALLIANGNYAHFPGLANPLPDAEKLSGVLKSLGFRVRIVRNGSCEDMLDGIKEFENSLRGTQAIAFFHYGGHGVQVGGRNYLLPADADIPDERRVATRAVELDEVMGALEAANAKANVVVIDACRNNPLPTVAGRDSLRGLSVVGTKPKNSIIIYAAEAGSVAVDGLFTPIFASALSSKGRTIEQIMKVVRKEVYEKSFRQQTPGEYNQLFDELFLGDPEDSLSKNYEISNFSPIIQRPSPPPEPKPIPTPNSVGKREAPPNHWPERLADQEKFSNDKNMILVEGGIIKGDPGYKGIPIASFYIGKTEVTWNEWKEVNDWANKNGYEIASGKGSGDKHPVRNVSWYDVVKWCSAKSEMQGLQPVYYFNNKIYKKGLPGNRLSGLIKTIATYDGYRLPKENEWTWAAKGGVKSKRFIYSGSNNLDDVAWFERNSVGAEIQIFGARGTWPVGLKKSNELQLFDMNGNVWEWCNDLSFETNRSYCGGCWIDSNIKIATVDTSNTVSADHSGPYVGFRLARSFVKKNK